MKTIVLTTCLALVFPLTVAGCGDSTPTEQPVTESDPQYSIDQAAAQEKAREAALEAMKKNRRR